ncbi:MAG: M56 family metallopeptidase [Victivallaceae bacterium]|nr:M56 family metallopeptidase [Victivallaceae bacterium]
MNELINFFLGSLLRGALLYLLFAMIFRTNRKIFWYAALLAMMIPPLPAALTLNWTPAVPEPVATGDVTGIFDQWRLWFEPGAADSGAAAAKAQTAQAGALENPASKIDSLSGQIDPISLIWTVYIMLCAALLIRLLCRGFRWNRKTLRLPEIESERVVAIFRRACGKLNVDPEKIALLNCDGALPVPASVGVFKKKLLFPQSSAATLSDPELEMLFLHEMFHLRMNDPAKTLLLNVMECMFRFNPFFRAAIRRVTLAREIECDAAVLKHNSNNPELTAGYLGMIFRFYTKPPAYLPAGAALSAGAKEIKERMNMITNPIRRRSTVLSALAALIAVTGVSLFAVSDRSDAEVKAESTYSELWNFVPETANEVIFVNGKAILGSAVWNNMVASLGQEKYDLLIDGIQLGDTIPSLSKICETLTDVELLYYKVPLKNNEQLGRLLMKSDKPLPEVAKIFAALFDSDLKPDQTESGRPASFSGVIYNQNCSVVELRPDIFILTPDKNMPPRNGYKLPEKIRRVLDAAPPDFAAAMIRTADNTSPANSVIWLDNTIRTQNLFWIQSQDQITLLTYAFDMSEEKMAAAKKYNPFYLVKKLPPPEAALCAALVPNFSIEAVSSDRLVVRMNFPQNTLNLLAGYLYDKMFPSIPEKMTEK